MGRRWRLAVMTTLLLSTAAMSGASAQDRTTVSVDLSAPGEPVNPKLGGLSWNAGESLDLVEEIAPRTVRIDGALQDLSPSEGVLELDRLLGRVAEIRRIGAEPLVILSYMPTWLGEPNAFGRDPTRVAPADLDAWEQLVEDVVRALAIAPAPAFRFEVWNEPDLPTFFQDLPTSFLDMAARSHRAVATVAEETGLPLLVGGPATAAPDPVYMIPYVKRMVDDGLPLDFISWHYYANHPFFGPDGNEGFVPDEVYELNARRNPGASPRLFGAEPELVRSFLAPVLAGTGREPELLLTEWNISAAGFDRRHATHEGAAFVIGTLIELERGGMDGADYYRAISNDVEHPGDWATVTASGSRRPSWWAMQAWNQTAAGTVLPIAGDDPASGFWARAARLPDGRIDVFLAAFQSDGDGGRVVDLAFEGLCPLPTARVSFLDATSTDLRSFDPVGVAGAPATMTIDVPTQSAAFVQLDCGTAAGAGGADPQAGNTSDKALAAPTTESIPATGQTVPAALIAAMVVLGITVRQLARRSA